MSLINQLKSLSDVPGSSLPKDNTYRTLSHFMNDRNELVMSMKKRKRDTVTNNVRGRGRRASKR